MKRRALCHPDLPVLARGMCKTCYWRDYERTGRRALALPRMSTAGACVCGKPIHAKRMCGTCYRRHAAALRQARVKPTCHPDRRVAARGMCEACYRKWRSSGADRVRANCPHPERAAYGKNGLCSNCFKLSRTYGLSAEHTRRVASAQLCEICRKRFGARRKRAVDHCHGTGKFRGVLCGQCNTALGLVAESTNILRSMVAYLKRTKHV